MTNGEKVAELLHLLDEAFDHFRDSGIGHWKSSEGFVSVSFGTTFDREVDGRPAVAVRGVDVYSYALGPSRDHHFDSLDEALAEVRKWHADEMATQEAS
jgi:hypothetical protein